MRFTASGLARGARAAIPIAASVFAFGMVFGALSRQAGLSLVQAMGMSMFVFAGSSQVLALGLWSGALPVVTIIVTTLLINLRYVLLATSLQPWFGRLRAPFAYLAVFFMADENWAISIRAFSSGEGDAAFLLGSGLALYVSWLSATILGQLVGAVVRDPAQFGLDFVFTAVFVALLTGMWRGRRDVLPWCMAAAVAVVSRHLLGGTWYIVLGGLAGTVVGAFMHES